MKNLLFAVILLLSLNGCKKRELDVSLKFDVTKLSLKEQREFLVKNLKVIASQVAIATKDPEVKALIEKEASKQFDGDYNVLIKELLNIPQFSSRVDVTKIVSAINAFKNIGGNHYYPQIYIPKLSNEIQDLALNRVEDESLEFVLYNGDETQNTFPAYELDGDDSLVLAGYDINEYYASIHNTYVFSINEIVNNNGGVPNTTHTSYQTDSTPPTTQPNFINVQFNKMTVLHHKESWAAGKSDIHIQAYTYTHNGYFNGLWQPPVVTNVSDRTSYDTYGCQIRRFTRNEIKNKTEITLNYNLERTWLTSAPLNNKIIYYFVVFEKDNWPAAVRVVQTPPMWVHRPDENQQFLQFRSSDNEYWLESFYSTFTGFSNLPPVVNYLTSPDNIYINNVIKELKRKENNSYQGIRFNITRY